MTTVSGVALEELPRWIGSLGQVAGIQSFVECEGPSRGARRMRIVTGGGLEVDLHPDRALDIGQVSFRGVPLAWVSPSGVTNPALRTGGANEWLRSFGGGLVATCGLDTFGPPSATSGIQYDMHGRIGSQPATITRSVLDNGSFVISAEIKQAVLFGENFLLQRKIIAPIGGSRIILSDTVTNQSSRDAGHMVLYHCNLGWPLISDATSLSISSRSVKLLDGQAADPDWSTMPPPTPNYRERVYCHTGFHDSPGIVVVDNPVLDLRLKMEFNSRTLPALFQWKMAGEGEYVLGIEPANTPAMGRQHAEGSHQLPVLAPRQSVDYTFLFHFSASDDIPSRSSQTVHHSRSAGL